MSVKAISQQLFAVDFELQYETVLVAQPADAEKLVAPLRGNYFHRESCSAARTKTAYTGQSKLPHVPRLHS